MYANMRNNLMKFNKRVNKIVYYNILHYVCIHYYLFLAGL